MLIGFPSRASSQHSFSRRCTRGRQIPAVAFETDVSRECLFEDRPELRSGALGGAVCEMEDYK